MILSTAAFAEAELLERSRSREVAKEGLLVALPPLYTMASIESFGAGFNGEEIVGT